MITSAGRSFQKIQQRNLTNSWEGNRSIEAIIKARLLCESALGKKASNIVIMDMRAVSNIADFFVICSASSARRVQAIATAIERDLAERGLRCGHVEGKKEALWVLIDYGDVVAHIFHEEMRTFYNLERLWHDAPKERFHHNP